MAKTAQDKRNAGGHRTPAPVPAPAASNATTGAVPPASGSQSVAVPSRSVVTSQMRVKPCTSDSVAQYNGTGDPLLLYTPEGGFIDDDSILKAIDLVEDTPTNSYLSDVKMARINASGLIE